MLHDAVEAYQIGNGSAWADQHLLSPASVHGLLSSDNERLKLCPRVQTPAPVLGRLHATVPGTLAVLVVRRTGRRLLCNPQPPTSPANMDPDRLYQTWWWGLAHSITQHTFGS